MIGQLQSSTLDFLIEGLQVIDPDWRYLYLNDAAVNQSKFPRNELIGYTMMEKYPGIENTSMYAVLEKCMKNRKPDKIENEFEFPDGSTGWFELRIQPVPEGIFILSMDISERKSRELNLADLNEQLEYAVLRRTAQLEARNQAMLESLDYAKSIQRAFLPQKEGLAKLFPNSFVIHKPKDIVSGDFYWYKNASRKMMLAAADCTGHGIPGALMSMIGIEKLNYAITQSRDPAEVLNRLNLGIKMAMRNCSKYEHSQDGMDIALCAIDRDQKTVEFAGANRPLWLVRNKEKTMETYRASRLSIGGKIGVDKAFVNQQFSYETGDTFYIFSDGYADSFNGMSGKKLKAKRFRDLLLDVQDQSMESQKSHLESFIEDWNTNGDQVDDILVIGVRL